MAPSNESMDQILVRVSTETYAALQLAIPFEGRRSMQDLVSTILDDYLASLRLRDPGYEQALVGLRESRARSGDVLARRRVDKVQRRRGSGPSS